MISDNQSICPKCGGQLKYYDHVQRLVRTKFGNKKWVAIRRLRCCKCHAVHRELPDFTSITRTSEQGDKTTYWTYQEAALTPQEFNEYTNLLMAENAIKGTNDSDNIVQIMAGQETGDSQQLAIMEAIADLYDAVAAMIPE